MASTVQTITIAPKGRRPAANGPPEPGSLPISIGCTEIKSMENESSSEATPQTNGPTQSKPPLTSSHIAVQDLSQVKTVSVLRRSQSVNLVQLPPPLEQQNGIAAKTSTLSRTSPKPKRARSGPRPSIRSLVPQTEILKIAERPDNGGTRGRKTELYTNHYACHLPEELLIYQYDCDLDVQQNGKWLNASRNKYDRFNIVQQIIRHETSFPFVWFDDGKNLYSLLPLNDLKKIYFVKVQQQSFRFTIRQQTREYNIKDMNLFSKKDKSCLMRPQDSIRNIETLLKQTIRQKMICIRQQFYYDKEQQIIDIGSGIGLARGFYQAMFLTKAGPTLNIDTKFSAFYQHMNLVDFISHCLQRDIIQTGLSEKEQEYLLRTHLKPVSIETRHTNSRMKYRIHGFGASANVHTFVQTGDEEEPQISVTAYILKKWNKKLQYPRLPTVEAYNPGNKNSSHIPMELCFIQEWQLVDQKHLTGEQIGEKTKKSVVKPEQRYNDIMEIVRKRQFNSDSYLREIGMTVESGEMLKVRARVLEPPEIEYRDQNVTVQIGKWPIKGKQLHETKQIKKWAIILVTGQVLRNDEQNVLLEFVRQFPIILGHCGLKFFSAPYCNEIVNPSRTDLHECLKYLKEQSYEVSLFLLYNIDEKVYQFIKRASVQLVGVVTQCADFAAIRKNITKLDMYLYNFVCKFNAKLGGINSLVNYKSVLLNSDVNNNAEDDCFMFIGADVTHKIITRGNPSIAAVVASRYPASTQYIGRSTEQRPKNDKKYSVEIIKDFELMCSDLLKVFAQTNGRLPTKIVVYRDGVDDGHFQKVLDNEVQALKKACKDICGEHQLPKITFVIIKKRHNTRFFCYDARKNPQTFNTEPGTVIDTEIVHPSQFDFYLNSHAAIQGTNNCILYHVLYNEIGFTSDEIQQLTYFLCHTDVRCTKAVKMPAAARYAHNIAYDARYLRGNDIKPEEQDRTDFNQWDDE
ncbi:unnamed protein product [Didymodactylos carnosus]|nr:unnamed protein product [Didymodactylos carnosus]CAF3582575.1 unnamed protein product [Didymodactylos carnosus]